MNRRPVEIAASSGQNTFTQGGQLIGDLPEHHSGTVSYFGTDVFAIRSESHGDARCATAFVDHAKQRTLSLNLSARTSQIEADENK